MPAALPFVAQAAVAAGYLTAAQAAAVAFAVTVGVASYQQNKAKNEMRRAAELERRGRSITVRSAIAARRIVLGTARVSGPLMYAEFVGDELEYLDTIVAVNHGELAEVLGVYIGDEYIPAANISSQAPTSGKFSTADLPNERVAEVFTVSGATSVTLANTPVNTSELVAVAVNGGINEGAWASQSPVEVSSVSGNVVNFATAQSGNVEVTYWTRGLIRLPLKVQWTMGTASQATTTWSGVSTPKWTTDHRLRGVAYVRTLKLIDHPVYAADSGDVGALARGPSRVYDPRESDPVPGVSAWNPSAKSSNITLSGSDLVATSNGNTGSVLGVRDRPASGDFSFEVVVGGSDTNRMIGIANGSVNVALYPGQDAHAYSIYGLNGNKFNNGTGTAYGTTFPLVAGDIVTVQLKAGELRFWKNGGGGTLAFSGLTGNWYPIYGTSSTGGSTGTATLVTASLTYLPSGSTAWGSGGGQELGNPSTWTPYTSNPALLAAWYRMLPRAEGGMGVPSDWIDWDSVATAANVCDELISVKKLDDSGYESIKRYECHTVLMLDRPPAENLAVILQSMAGDFPFTGGLYRCYAGAFRTATVTLTDADVAAGEDIEFAPQAGSSLAPPNMVSATFYDAQRAYTQTGAQPVVNSTYVTDDGAEEPVEVDLPATTDSRQANYLMGVLLERQRNSLQGRLTVTGRGANLALLDTVQLNLTGYSALAGKTFEVRRRTNAWTGRYPIELREVKSTTYALDADRYTPADPAAPPDNSALFDVDALTITSCVVQALAQNDGTVLHRAYVQWDRHPQGYVTETGHIEIRARRAGGQWVYSPLIDGGQTAGYTVPLQSGAAVLVEVRAVNGNGVAGPWAAAPVAYVGVPDAQLAFGFEAGPITRTNVA